MTRAMPAGVYILFGLACAALTVPILLSLLRLI